MGKLSGLRRATLTRPKLIGMGKSIKTPTSEISQIRGLRNRIKSKSQALSSKLAKGKAAAAVDDRLHRTKVAKLRDLAREMKGQYR